MNALTSAQRRAIERQLRHQRGELARDLRASLHRAGEEQPPSVQDYLHDECDPAEADELLAEDMARLGQRAELLLAIDRALRRLADGTFGSCTRCGALVGASRLLALPTAACCLACQEELERLGRLHDAGG